MAFAVGSGPLMADLGNAVSDAINAALRKGMDGDEACSVAIKVVGDYWRHYYGEEGLQGLATLLYANPEARRAALSSAPEGGS